MQKYPFIITVNHMTTFQFIFQNRISLQAWRNSTQTHGFIVCCSVTQLTLNAPPEQIKYLNDVSVYLNTDSAIEREDSYERLILIWCRFFLLPKVVQ